MLVSVEARPNSTLDNSNSIMEPNETLPLERTVRTDFKKSKNDPADDSPPPPPPRVFMARSAAVAECLKKMRLNQIEVALILVRPNQIQWNFYSTLDHSTMELNSNETLLHEPEHDADFVAGETVVGDDTDGRNT